MPSERKYGHNVGIRLVLRLEVFYLDTLGSLAILFVVLFQLFYDSNSLKDRHIDDVFEVFFINMTGISGGKELSVGSGKAGC